MDDKHYLYLSIHDPLLRGCRVAAVALPRVVSPWSHCCVSCRRGRAAARCTAAHAVVLPCVVPPSCLLPIVLWPRCCVSRRGALLSVVSPAPCGCAAVAAVVPPQRCCGCCELLSLSRSWGWC